MSVLISPDDLERRRDEIASSPQLRVLERHLSAALEPVLVRPVYVPAEKALLSRWGGHCRDDGAELAFDPSSPHAQRCPACGRVRSDEQAHRWWVHWYHLWLAERAWQLALLSFIADEGRLADRTLEILAAFAERYQTYPNADNVLGPSRPFFSTYLESIWVLHLAATTSLLGERGLVPADLARDLREKLFRPSAELIADFPEGRSNRQVWNAAAQYALGAVLEDAALRQEAAHGPQGILATLDAGLLDDGLWFEGENYHWFALRGLVWGAEMLRAAGELDLWTDGGAAARKFRAAFWTPVLTALPDFTFPARRDSKYGVSLRHRRMAELWELAWTRLALRELPSLLAYVYDATVPAQDDLERTITEVDRSEAAAGVRRDALGWKGLLWMAPALAPEPRDAWRPASVHLEATGLAVFRRHGGATYVSLDYGESGGGHGHPDRLNLTVHSGGVPWLVDFGTGSYVAPSLGWYRTTLAHNAPLVDALSQAPANGECVAYDEAGEFGWVCAQLPDGGAYEGAAIQRTVVATPWYVLDVVQMGSSAGERSLAVPWHGLGRLTTDEAGFLFERLEGVLRVAVAGRQPFQVQHITAPGPPGHQTAELEFPVVVATGEELALVACVGLAEAVEEVECVGAQFVVRLADGGMHTHQATETGWRIDLGRGDPIELGGLREEVAGTGARGHGGTEDRGGRRADAQAETGGRRPDAQTPRVGATVEEAAGRSLRVEQAPALDGTLDGFKLDAPLVLDREDQFRRAEERWGGPDEFAARAYLNHADSTLFVAVEVVAPHPAFRPPGAPDPELENENPDIHGDGLQLYVETTDFYGWLVVPDAYDRAHVRVSSVRGTDAQPEMVVRGAWVPTPNGYRVTLAIELPSPVEDFGFDLSVNRGREGRQRRTGQLVWSGARGTRLYLAGDRPLEGNLPRVEAKA